MYKTGKTQVCPTGHVTLHQTVCTKQGKHHQKTNKVRHLARRFGIILREEVVYHIISTVRYLLAWRAWLGLLQWMLIQ